MLPLTAVVTPVPPAICKVPPKDWVIAVAASPLNKILGFANFVLGIEPANWVLDIVPINELVG